MVMAVPLSHVDADRCQSPDSSFVICLSGETRGATQGKGEEGLQSPSTAQTPDLDIAIAQHSDPPLPPTVSMRSPTVSAVVATAATKTAKPPCSAGTTTAATAAATPSSRVDATKVPRSPRDSTLTAETLRQKRSTSGPAYPVNLVAAVEKPMLLMPVLSGSSTEENKAPSPGRCKNPIGLPPLRRGRMASAQPASCGKQAASATAAAATSPAVVDFQSIMAASMVNTTAELAQVAAAPASGFKRAHSSQSPIGLGGAALPLPPSKRARTNTKGGLPVPTDVIIGKHATKSLTTSFKVDQQQRQRDVPLNIATNTAAAVAAPQQRESRRQRIAATRKSTTLVPVWVQKAAEAPQVNAVLLSAAEKIKPAGGGTGACPTWRIAGEKNERRTRPKVENPDNTDDEEAAADKTERKIRQGQDLTTNTTTTNDDTTGVESYNNKVLFVPGWEAVLQTADAAPREYKESETVAEILTLGGKCNVQREYALLKNNRNNDINESSDNPAFGSPSSPAVKGAARPEEALDRADGSLFRQGFGISEFAARMSIVASGLSPDIAGKESLVQRAKRVMHGVITGTSTGNAGALEKGGSKEESGKERGGTTEKTDMKITNLSSAAAAAVTSEQKEGQKQQQKQRAPFAIGHAISNVVAQALQTRGQASFNRSNRGRYKRRKNGHLGGVNLHERRKREEQRNSRPPLPKPRSGGGGSGSGNAGGSGGIRDGAPVKSAVGGNGVQQRQPLQTPSEERGTARIVHPPKVWPSLGEQFAPKGGKGSVNVNELAKGSRLSGSGLDLTLWNELFKK